MAKNLETHWGGNITYTTVTTWGGNVACLCSRHSSVAFAKVFKQLTNGKQLPTEKITPSVQEVKYGDIKNPTGKIAKNSSEASHAVPHRNISPARRR